MRAQRTHARDVQTEKEIGSGNRCMRASETEREREDRLRGADRVVELATLGLPAVRRVDLPWTSHSRTRSIKPPSTRTRCVAQIARTRATHMFARDLHIAWST